MSQPIFKHPRALYILSFGELWERFSYYGTQMILVLYLTKVFSFSDNQSYAIYGTYAAFAFAMLVLGGTIADRLLGFHRAILAGACLLIIGNILLAIPNAHCLYIGLAVDVCGIGLYKPNSLALLGAQYGEHHAQREAGFTWVYIGMNIGGTFGPIVYGLLTQYLGWHVGFIFSAITLFISLIIFLFNQKHLSHTNTQATSRNQHGLAYTTIIAICAIISWLFLQPNILDNLILIFSPVVVCMLIIMALRQQPLLRNRIFALLILAVFMMFFYAASLQVGSSINLFIDRDINRTLFGWTIPTVLFSSLYPLFVVLMAPILTPLWQLLAAHKKNPTAQIKLFIGILLAASAFIAFAFAAASNTNNHVPLVWITIGNLLLGTGELCLMPAALATISRFTPSNLHGTMIGTWYLFIALGGYLSGILAKFSNQNVTTVTNKILSNAVYHHTFIFISISTFVVAGLLLALIPIVKSLLAAEKN